MTRCWGKKEERHVAEKGKWTYGSHGGGTGWDAHRTRHGVHGGHDTDTLHETGIRGHGDGDGELLGLGITRGALHGDHGGNRLEVFLGRVDAG